MTSHKLQSRGDKMVFKHLASCNNTYMGDAFLMYNICYMAHKWAHTPIIQCWYSSRGKCDVIVTIHFTIFKHLELSQAFCCSQSITKIHIYFQYLISPVIWLLSDPGETQTTFNYLWQRNDLSNRCNLSGWETDRSIIYVTHRRLAGAYLGWSDLTSIGHVYP